MKGIPKLKPIDHLIRQGRKDLSASNVAELNQLLDDLKKVRIVDRTKALEQQGIINTYLNNFDIATDSYLESYQLNYNEQGFKNYLYGLRFLKKHEIAVFEGLKYLKNNPNNTSIFEVVMSLLLSYKYENALVELYEYLIYQPKNKKEFLERGMLHIYNLYKDINKSSISTTLFNKIIAIVDNELAKIFINMAFPPFIYFDKDETCLYYQISKLPEYSDISLLNQNYEKAIEKAIENGEIDFDEYIDSLSQLVIGFSANPNQESVHAPY